MKLKNNLLCYKDLYIYQESNHFNFCLDSVLLARFVVLNSKTKRLIDVGTNNCVIPLILSRYTSSKITAVELQKSSSDIANENVMLNNKQNQIVVYNEDINQFCIDKNNMFDVVICNPPFFKVSKGSKFKESQEISIARHELKLTLDQLIKSSRILLNNEGKLYMIHLTDRFDEVITKLCDKGFVAKKVRFIYSKKSSLKSDKFLVEAKLSNKQGCTIMQPLYVHNEDGTYTDEVKKYFKD
ncbi:tRNA1(Val) (adenine(37)-N6)-methyltransferase [Spiroplasma turonicum]|uniref:Putative methyltransferase n=1 Tax=Spiroplasma turonicum TaxID=216946 RepID=A0A0K1P4P0_9MOLU|nr:methyltransferase [Spiroplasma turonicum]AKU79256.1 putative methyltransferase [Spiroplasma turonicum]ALX70279.1 methyltransferase [Spiroplasma turonicum]